jgi:alanine-glyoxylate transaminase/serine-glyoxylate transaminase/serine-pyruvate transaminase
MGFSPLVDAADRLPMLTSVKLPQKVQSLGEDAVRSRLLNEFDIEVGAGLGPLAGEIWRIGLMGENARPEPVDRLLKALHVILD